MQPSSGCTMFCIMTSILPNGGAIYDAPNIRKGAIYDAPKNREGAIFDAYKVEKNFNFWQRIYFIFIYVHFLFLLKHIIPKVSSDAIYDAPKITSGAICDAPQVRSGAIFDAPICEPGSGCIRNCSIVVSFNKVLIILMLGSLLEVH